MIRWTAGALLGAVLLVTGCASTPVQAPIGFSKGYFAGPAKVARVAIVMSEVPKPDTWFPGADCLLCLAFANASNTSLTAHVRTLDAGDELKTLKQDLAALITKKGLTVVVVDEPLVWAQLPDMKVTDPTGKARKDFSSFKTRYQADKVLAISVTQMGVYRNYAAYVPRGVPYAMVSASAQMIDTSSHDLDWYEPLGIQRSTEGAWDEPPKFPGLTNAYYQVIDDLVTQLKGPFKP